MLEKGSTVLLILLLLCHAYGTLPPLDSEIGWTGELCQRLISLNGKTIIIAFSWLIEKVTKVLTTKNGIKFAKPHNQTFYARAIDSSI